MKPRLKMIPIKDNYENLVRTRLWKTGEQIIGFIRPKDSILDRPSDRGVESLRFHVSIVRKIAVSNPTQAGDAVVLVNVEYPFIAIAPRSTLVRHRSTW